MIICIFLNVLNFTAATSRQIFAFARDDGFPFRHWIARVNRKTGSPQNALAVVILFVVLIALIVLGSTVAFRAIISLGTHLELAVANVGQAGRKADDLTTNVADELVTGPECGSHC